MEYNTVVMLKKFTWSSKAFTLLFIAGCAMVGERPKVQFDQSSVTIVALEGVSIDESDTKKLVPSKTRLTIKVIFKGFPTIGEGGVISNADQIKIEDNPWVLQHRVVSARLSDNEYVESFVIPPRGSRYRFRVISDRGVYIYSKSAILDGPIGSGDPGGNEALHPTSFTLELL